jgi:hypothetical protein
MKKLCLLCVAVAIAPAFSFAAPGDDVKAAAKKLGDAANYSWTTNTEMANAQFTPGPVQGQAEKGGYAVVTREFNGNSMQSVYKGDQMAMNRDGSWVTREELAQQFGGGQGGGRGRGGFFGGAQQTPVQEIDALVAAAKDWKAADGAIVGDLSAEVVGQRLAFGGRGGQAPAAPKNATGTVKVWLKDGAVAKYQVHVKGTVPGRDGGEQERDVTTTTEIKDIGSTKVTVPEEAKKKLGA